MMKQLIRNLNGILSAQAVLAEIGEDGFLTVFQGVNAFPEEDVKETVCADEWQFCRSFAFGKCTKLVFNKDQAALHVLFDAEKREVRLLRDNESDFIPSYHKIETGDQPVRFWQFEVGHSLIDCGMCYIFLLSDGTFCLIDSAHHYSVHDDERIVDFLRRHTPAGSPIIVKGWIFTHGHDDHIAKFLDVARYHPEVKIQKIYENFIPEKMLPVDVFSTADRSFTASFRALIKEKAIPRYRPHALDMFYIGDLKITVLCNYEDLLPEVPKNYNDSSLTFLVQAGEDRVLFLGDAGHMESEVLKTRYGSDLKCDIVQQAHHGHFGVTPDLYKKANAAVALFPTTYIKFCEELHRYPANEESLRIAKHVFVASDGTVGFTFPLRKNKIIRYPDETFEDFQAVERLWDYTYSDAYKQELRQRFADRQEIQEVAW